MIKHTKKTFTRWTLQWRSENKRDGRREYMCASMKGLFDTRAEARAAQENEYCYLQGRPDLRAEPHGWLVPKVVKVKVTISICR
jgi:hypothetical protein